MCNVNADVYVFSLMAKNCDGNSLFIDKQRNYFNKIISIIIKL